MNIYVVATCKRSLGQGNVFMPACQSFCSQGGWCTPPRQTPPRQTPLPLLGRHPPETVPEAGGTHPTGMHSCLKVKTRTQTQTHRTFSFCVAFMLSEMPLRLFLYVNSIWFRRHFPGKRRSLFRPNHITSTRQIFLFNLKHEALGHRLPKNPSFVKENMSNLHT